MHEGLSKVDPEPDAPYEREECTDNRHAKKRQMRHEDRVPQNIETASEHCGSNHEADDLAHIPRRGQLCTT